jgi:8-oxo-dGTP diphosphatase
MAVRGKYTYDWPRPMVTADAAVFVPAGQTLQVLLIRRGQDPYEGCWALPGGFVEMDEDLGEAAVRELAEETGLEGVTLEQFRTFGKPGRDPRGRVVTIVFTAALDAEPTDVQAGDDAAEAAWFDVAALPEMAFDHAEVVSLAAEYVHQRMRTS